MTVIALLAALAYIVSVPAAWFVGPWPYRLRLKWASVAFAIVAMVAYAAKGEPFWSGVWVFNGLAAVVIVFLAYRQRELEDDSDRP
jgi:hypothetical protein